MVGADGCVEPKDACAAKPKDGCELIVDVVPFKCCDPKAGLAAGIDDVVTNPYDFDVVEGCTALKGWAKPDNDCVDPNDGWTDINDGCEVRIDGCTTAEVSCLVSFDGCTEVDGFIERPGCDVDCPTADELPTANPSKETEKQCRRVTVIDDVIDAE